MWSRPVRWGACVGAFAVAGAALGALPATAAPRPTGDRPVSVVPLELAVVGPTGVVAEAGDRSARLRWVAPRAGGGIVGYRAYAIGQSAGCVTDGATACLVPGLANGVEVAFVVEAITTSGTGSESTPSHPVMPGRVPGSPADVVVRANGNSARVSWGAPADTGEMPGLIYQVTSRLGPGCTVAAPALACTVSDLPPGVVQRFEVAAGNRMGWSRAAPSGDGLTPGQPTPSPPVGVRAAIDPASGATVVRWRRPVTAGMAPIVSFAVRAGHGWSCDVPAAAAHCHLSPPNARRSQVSETTGSEGPRPPTGEPIVVTAQNEYGIGAESEPARVVGTRSARPASGRIQTATPTTAVVDSREPPVGQAGESYAVLVGDPRPTGIDWALGPNEPATADVDALQPTTGPPAQLGMHVIGGGPGILEVRWRGRRAHGGDSVLVTLSPGDRTCAARARTGRCRFSGLDRAQGFSAVARRLGSRGWSTESAATPLVAPAGR